MRHDQLLTKGFDDFEGTRFNKWKTIGSLEAFRTRQHRRSSLDEAGSFYSKAISWRQVKSTIYRGTNSHDAQDVVGSGQRRQDHEPRQTKHFQLSLNRGGSPCARTRGIGFDNTTIFSERSLCVSHCSLPLIPLEKEGIFFPFPLEWFSPPNTFPQALHNHSTKYLTIR